MPFWVMIGVGRRMGVLDGVEIVERDGAVLGVNVGCPIVTNGILCMRGGNALFQNDFGRTCLACLASLSSRLYMLLFLKFIFNGCLGDRLPQDEPDRSSPNFRDW